MIKNLGAWVEETIKTFINTSPENTIYKEKYERAFADPIIGFSRGDDPLFHFFKEDIGSFYWTPLEIFKKTFPQMKVTPNQLTVISWILPQTEATKSDNRKQTFYPSERWARVRWLGPQINVKLSQHVITTLQNEGFKAVSPTLSPLWSDSYTSERYGFACS